MIPALFAAPDEVVEIHREVEDHHSSVGCAFQQGPDALRVPAVALVAEHPSLHHPHGVGVGLGERTVDGFAIVAERRGAFGRSLGAERHVHLVEAVDEVVFALAELLLPGADESRADLRKERIEGREHPVFEAAPFGFGERRLRVDALHGRGNEACEPLVNRGHAEGLHAVDDAVLEGDLRLVPLGGRCAVEPAHVAHSHPRQVGGAGEEHADLLVGEPHPAPYAGEDGLAGDRCQRHVEAVEGHPVDLALPFVPAPERRGVAEGADVHVEPPFEGRRDLPPRCVGEALREVEAAARPCADAVAVRRNVVVETPAEGHGAAALDAEASLAGLHGEAVAARRRLVHEFQLHVCGPAARCAGDHAPGFVDGCRCRGGQSRRKHCQRRQEPFYD